MHLALMEHYNILLLMFGISFFNQPETSPIVRQMIRGSSVEDRPFRAKDTLIRLSIWKKYFLKHPLHMKKIFSNLLSDTLSHMKG